MALSEVLTCYKCKTEKSVTEFAQDKSRKQGFRYSCKSCESIYRKVNRKRAYEYHKAYCKANRPKLRLQERCRKKGITTKEYLEMFRSQNGKCAICGVSHLELNRPLNIDHCHKTNKVRKLLCDNCNKILGFSRESEEILMKVIQYIKEHEVVYGLKCN